MHRNLRDTTKQNRDPVTLLDPVYMIQPVVTPVEQPVGIRWITGKMFIYMMQPVVQPVVQPV